MNYLHAIFIRNTFLYLLILCCNFTFAQRHTQFKFNNTITTYNDTSCLQINWESANSSELTAKQFDKIELQVIVPHNIAIEIKNHFKPDGNPSNPKLNPLARQDIEVKMTVTADDQFVQEVNGFFAPRSLMRGQSHNVSYDLFYLRFSIPYFVGNWKGKIEVISKGKETFTKEFSFKMTKSNNVGFIEKGRNLNTYCFSKSKKSFIPASCFFEKIDPIFSNLASFSSYKEQCDTLFQPIPAIFEDDQIKEFKLLRKLDLAIEAANLDSNQFYSIHLLTKQLLDNYLRELKHEINTENQNQFKLNIRNYIRYMSARYGYSAKIFDFVLYDELDLLLNQNYLGKKFNKDQHIDWMQNLAKYLKEDLGTKQLVSCQTRKLSLDENETLLSLHPMIDVLRLPCAINVDFKNNLDKKSKLYVGFNDTTLTENEKFWWHEFPNLGNFDFSSEFINKNEFLEKRKNLIQNVLTKIDFNAHNYASDQSISRFISKASSKKITAKFLPTNGFIRSSIDSLQSFGYIKIQTSFFETKSGKTLNYTSVKSMKNRSKIQLSHLFKNHNYSIKFYNCNNPDQVDFKQNFTSNQNGEFELILDHKINENYFVLNAQLN